MARREEFIRYAAECIALAQQTQNPVDRARFLQIAQAWRELAEKSSTQDEPKMN
jgi:hypothetical protein